MHLAREARYHEEGYDQMQKKEMGHSSPPSSLMFKPHHGRIYDRIFPFGAHPPIRIDSRSISFAPIDPLNLSARK